MKRIDVLKDIERILVQKAYETGHISHRADGDWQKQADGSWKPYTGQSNQNFKKYDNRTRFGGDGTLLTQDQVAELQQIKDMNERKKRQEEMLAENRKDTDSSYEKMKYSEITEEDLKELDKKDSNTPIKNKLSKEEKANINNKLYDVLSFYDSDAKELFGMNRTNNGELDGSPSISYDWRTDRVLPADKDKFDKVVRHYMDKAGVEDTPLNYKQAYNTIKGMAINNGMLQRTNHPLDAVDKSYRDMRSAPTTKNMGF